MYSLDIASVHRDRPLPVKSAPYLRLDRSALRAGPADTRVADYNDYVWLFDGKYSTEIDITRPCLIHFESAGEKSPSYGPFSEIHIDGPSIFFGPRFEEVLARYDREKHQWLACGEGRYYEAVVIDSA
jgi:hypothetical protein